MGWACGGGVGVGLEGRGRGGSRVGVGTLRWGSKEIEVENQCKIRTS